MLTEQSLLDILHRTKPSNKDALLLCLAVDVEKPKKVRDINSLAEKVGFRSIGKLNTSAYLSKSNGLAHQLQVKHFNNLSRVDIGVEFG